MIPYVCKCYLLYLYISKVSQNDVITIDSDDDESVGSEIILISDSEPDDQLFPDYEEEEEADVEINLEENCERNQDVKGTFPLVKIFGFYFFILTSNYNKLLSSSSLITWCLCFPIWRLRKFVLSNS